MSYRSFTRVLGGDTNLERKCRLLFGVSLLLLIVGAFWYAERLTHNLIIENTRQSGANYVESSLDKSHYVMFLTWGLTGGNTRLDKEVSAGIQDMLKAYFRDTRRAHFSTEILKEDEQSSLLPGMDYMKWEGARPRVATHPQEIERMQELYLQQLEDLQQHPQLAEGSATQSSRPDTLDHAQDPLRADDESPPSSRNTDNASQRPPASDPVSYLKPDPKRGFVYYQPVYWKKMCGTCHINQRRDDGSFEWPFRVVKVVIPAEKTTSTMNKVIALLLTAAFVTVFLAMIALYVVVRYVIVKPLKHLCDISEEVRRGNTNLRADLQTNDEFQELGDSFNRMLRHFVDAQMELREANRQLDGRLDQLAQANMQLFEMNRLKNDFLANMSHELRTPLNSIIGFADVLQGVEALDTKQRRYASNIGRSGRVLLEIINDILDLAKIESGRMECRPTDFSVEALIYENCDMVRSLSEEKNIDLEVRVSPELPLVYQDQGKVQQVLTNLLSNAIKFTPEGGRITVSAARGAAGELVLVVADTGIGISEEDRQVIFEKFRQGSAVLGSDHLTREYSGTGLGLSIVKELCRLLEGEITFTSEVGKGSEFTVTLPWRWSKPARHETALANRLEEATRSGRFDPARMTIHGAHDQ